MGTRRQFTSEQRAEFVKKVEALVAEGTNAKDACRSLGLNDNSYYRWRIKPKRTYSPRKPKTEASLVTLPMKNDPEDFAGFVSPESIKKTDRLMVLIGSSQDVQNALRSLVALAGAL